MSCDSKLMLELLCQQSCNTFGDYLSLFVQQMLYLIKALIEQCQPSLLTISLWFLSNPLKTFTKPY